MSVAFALAAYFVITPLSTSAQTPQPGVDEIISFLEADKNTLRRIAAEYASGHIDFLDIGYLEPSDSNNKGGFTVAYKWNAESADQWVGEENGRYAMRRTSYGLDIDGKYAFNDALNDQDLSTVSVNFAVSRGDFGQLRTIPNADAFMDCLIDQEARVPQPPAGTDPNDPVWDEYQANASKFEKACWVDHGIDKVVKSYGAAHVYGGDLHLNLEGNQDYSERNLVFGLSAVFAMQPSAATQKRNIFDFPFRLMRESFSTSDGYVAPWPSIKVDIDRVDAADNAIRESLTTETTYTRAAGEIAFQTIVASFKSQPVRFNTSYRYFYEFSAPSEIKAADLDSFDYLAMSLRFPARLIPLIQSDDYEFFFSYSTGQLPFDLQSERAFEVGIGTNISQLGRLFSE